MVDEIQTGKCKVRSRQGQDWREEQEQARSRFRTARKTRKGKVKERLKQDKGQSRTGT